MPHAMQQPTSFHVALSLSIAIPRGAADTRVSIVEVAARFGVDPAGSNVPLKVRE
jgi:hypothetical protein